MAGAKGEETALGSARGRFIESLPRKAIELRGAIALLTATPAAEGPREDMRRRLHTLYASAVVFRNDALASAVKEGIERLDAAREQARPLDASDLDMLARLVKRLPELRGDGESSASSVSVAPSAPAPSIRPVRAVSGSLPPVLDSRPPESNPASGALPQSASRSASVSEPPRFSPARPSRVPTHAPAAPPSGAPAPEVEVVPPPSRQPREDAAEGRTELVLSRDQKPMLQRVLQVLVLPAPGEQDALKQLLRSESLDLRFVPSARSALESARENAPDLVLADERLALEGDLLGALRGDPLTDFVPVVLLAAESATEAVEARLDADERVLRPFDADRLVRVIGSATGTLVESGGALAAIGEATLDEVADRVAEEVRRGIVEAAESGRDLRIPFGEGAEVLAAAWAAITRVRAHVAEQSAGRVRFRDRPTRGGPALLALGAGGQAELPPQPEGGLRGRRILVVDDDTAVVWFFASLLRDEGATVIEFGDGREALRAARRERPDVVISDVLMPGLDGFGLCRELKRDPVLAEVPVILLSWKDDLLLRMRELASGASGYLRKEASAAQVLASVREVLRPRVRLEEQLSGEGEVRGKLEGTGVVSLMRSVRRVRPNARVTLRDAWNLFECELRDGRLVQVTRTATDGSFVRGERALPHLLGATTGRYTVAVADAAIKPAFTGTLDEELTRGASELGAQLDALSEPLLGRIARVVFDEDAYAALLEQSPPALRQVVERLHDGEAPLKLAKSGVVALPTLEAILLDMGRRGAVRGVIGTGGEDLFAEARALRGQEPPTSLASPRSIVPEAPNPVISVREAPQDDAPALDGSAAQVVAAPESSATSREASSAPPTHQESAPSSPAEPRAVEAVQAPAPAAQLASEPDQAPAPAEHADEVLEAPPAPVVPDPRLAPPPDDPELDSAAVEERRSRSTLLAWAIALVGICGAALYAERVFGPQADPSQVELIGARSERPAKGTPVSDSANEAAEGQAPRSAASAPVETSPANPDLPEDPALKVYNGILEPALVPDPAQSLLLVEAAPALSGAELSVDGKVVGGLPAKLPLSPGTHEVALRLGDTVSYRYVSVRPGKTWVLRSR